MNYRKVKLSSLFIVLYSLMLISRIYVIANIYTLPVNPTILQLGYVFLLLTINFTFKTGFKINKKIDYFLILSGVLVLYYILFCFIFVNPAMAGYTRAMAQRQGLFLLVIISTAMVVRKYRLYNVFIKTSFYTLGFVLLIQMLTNAADIKMINIMSVFNTATRSRVNFGFSHYNILGTVCACAIVLGLLMKGRNCISRKEKRIVIGFLLLEVVMLLGSASRNAITGLLLYGLVDFYLKLSKYQWGKLYKWIAKFLIIVFSMFLVVFGVGNLSIESMLLESNRFTLFSVALPTFFASGRTLIGLGLASSEIYGLNETPYKTYWLDNGYIYTLVSTGYIGFLLYGIAMALLIWRMRNLYKKGAIGPQMIGIMMMYLFGALFETTLFNGGVIQNYVYIVIFFICASDYFEKELN